MNISTKYIVKLPAPAAKKAAPKKAPTPGPKKIAAPRKSALSGVTLTKLTTESPRQESSLGTKAWDAWVDGATFEEFQATGNEMK